MDYVQISEEEGEEPIELPTEDDGTLLLSTLQAQFPGSCGLKCRNEETKAVRGVRLNEGRFYPPSSSSSSSSSSTSNKSGWGSQIYFCVFPKENKRKSDDNLENSTAKTKRVETRLRCTDLIVLGLSFKTTEESLREHFEKYGEVLMSQVKKDFKTGQSKGFGFVRFSSYESQVRVLAARHLIDDRWCEVKIPNSKEGIVQQLPSKIFVGRCTEEISSEDLREYFSKFGEVTDVFIPRPFRAFSFVTFLDPEIAQSLCGEDHIIKGVSVYVSNAAPKTERNRNGQQSYNNYNNFNNGGGGGGGVGGGGVGGGGLGSMMGGGRGNNNQRGGGGGGGYSGGGGGGGGYGGNSGSYGGGGGPNHNGVGGYNMNNGMMGNGHNGGGVPTYGMNGSNGGGSGSNGSGGSWNNNQNRGNLDMPNLQALGINPQGQNPNSSQGGQNMGSNPLGVGLNLGSMPMNPAIVAAALNQWGLLGGNFQNPSQQDQQGGGGSIGNSGNSQSWPRKSNVATSQGSDQAANFI